MRRKEDSTGVSIARLTEQIDNLSRRITSEHDLTSALIISEHDLTSALIISEHDLTSALFVTHEILVKSEADKVQLALAASDKAITKQETGTELAINKQEKATEKRFESVNEFRAQLADLIARFATVERVDLLFQQLTAQLSDSRKDQDARMTRDETTIKDIQIWQGNITGRLAVGGIVLTVLMTVIIFVANYATKG